MSIVGQTTGVNVMENARQDFLDGKNDAALAAIDAALNDAVRMSSAAREPAVGEDDVDARRDVQLARGLPLGLWEIVRILDVENARIQIPPDDGVGGIGVVIVRFAEGRHDVLSGEIDRIVHASRPGQREHACGHQYQQTQSRGIRRNPAFRQLQVLRGRRRRNLP